MRKLEEIINSLKSKGYNFEYNLKDSTIFTRMGEVKVNIHDEEGQPYCYPFLKEIHLFDDNEDLDLIHEREHFQLFHYEIFSFFIPYLSTISYTTYEVCTLEKENSYLIGGIFGLIMFGSTLKVHNLFSDATIAVRRYFGMDKRS